MSAPNSPIAICRLALDLLKQTAVVTSITNPTTTEEKRCARWYDATRRALLRKHFWVFARTRASIPRDSVTPAFGYSDAYNLPTNFLRKHFIGDDSTNDYITDSVIEGRQILLNNSGATSLNIGYIIDVTTVGKFDALFVLLLAAELANNMAYSFTGKNTVIERLETTLLRLREEAKAVNGQDRPPKRVQSSKFQNARRKLYSGADKYTRFD